VKDLKSVNYGGVEQAHAAATAATEKVNQEVKSVKDAASRDWKALEAKIAADIQALTLRKREREAGRAEHAAERLEWEAGFAIDYAVASIEQAELAVLDAIAGRVAAEYRDVQTMV